MGNKFLDNLVETKPKDINLSDKGIKEFSERLSKYLYFLINISKDISVY